MKLDVPFYLSKNDVDCGPLALKMVLEFFGEKHSFEELAKLERCLPSGLVWSAGIALAAQKLGFSTEFYSTSNFDIEKNEIEYYKKNADDKARQILQEILVELSKLNGQAVNQDLTIEELLSFVTHDSAPIVLINWVVVADQ